MGEEHGPHRGLQRRASLPHPGVLDGPTRWPTHLSGALLRRAVPMASAAASRTHGSGHRTDGVSIHGRSVSWCRATLLQLRQPSARRVPPPSYAAKLNRRRSRRRGASSPEVETPRCPPRTPDRSASSAPDRSMGRLPAHRSPLRPRPAVPGGPPTSASRSASGAALGAPMAAGWEGAAVTGERERGGAEALGGHEARPGRARLVSGPEAAGAAIDAPERPALASQLGEGTPQVGLRRRGRSAPSTQARTSRWRSPPSPFGWPAPRAMATTPGSASQRRSSASRVEEPGGGRSVRLSEHEPP